MTVFAPVLTAPHLSRWSLTDLDGRDLWVDAPPTWTPTPAFVEGRGYAVDPTSRSWALTSPVVSDGAVVHRLPWRPALLASILVAGRRSTAGSTVKVEEAGRALGRFARWLHSERSDELGTARVGGPTWLDRLADPPPASLAARPHWRELRTRVIEAGDGLRAPVHGELRTDHVLVPSSTRTPPAVTVLRVPGQPVVADPALDVGSLLGDLAEVALLGSRPAFTLAEAVSREYADERPMGDVFWLRVSGYAALKVVEHELRLQSSRGLETSAATVDRLDELARRVATCVAGLVEAGLRRYS